jgi:RNA-binding protein
MRRAGEAVRAAGGLVLLRVPEDAVADPGAVDRDHPDLPGVPGIGTELVDDSLTTVGRVVDVFGPVSRPYLAVATDRREPAALLGDRLYVPD